MAVAHTVSPDLFITHRHNLLAQANATRGLTVCDVTGALALLGLYLRAQHDYRIWFDPDDQFNVNIGKGFFSWAAARDLLRAAWRWVTACSRHADGAADDVLRYLALSLVERMVQAPNLDPWTESVHCGHHGVEM
jgi:hypothetical protein